MIKDFIGDEKDYELEKLNILLMKFINENKTNDLK